METLLAIAHTATQSAWILVHLPHQLSHLSNHVDEKPSRGLLVSTQGLDHGNCFLTDDSYCRRIIIGVTLFCLGGFHALNSLLHVSVYTAGTALPSIITVVLLYQKIF